MVQTGIIQGAGLTPMVQGSVSAKGVDDTGPSETSDGQSGHSQTSDGQSAFLYSSPIKAGSFGSLVYYCFL